MAAKGTVRVFIGTRKGTYVAESDAKRRKWKTRGPYQEGWDVFHVKSDPRHKGHVYMAANSGFFGPMILRSEDGGKKWAEIAAPLLPMKAQRPNPFESPEAPKWPIQNLWHIEPGHASEPNTLFVGVDPYSLYRSDDLGASWQPVPGLNDHPTKSKWNPGNGGPCLHTILIDPDNRRRMYVGISAAGTFRSDDGGDSWRPANKGVVVDFLPDKNPEVGQCVHKVVLDPADSKTMYRQDHNGIFVSHDSMDSWQRVGQKLKSDFGFVVAAPNAKPGTAYFVPLGGESRTPIGEGLEVYRWDDRKHTFTPLIRNRLNPSDAGTHREGLAIDAMDPPGIYVGTTAGQLIYSPDDGRNWSQLSYTFPGIHSVSVDSGRAA